MWVMYTTGIQTGTQSDSAHPLASKIFGYLLKIVMNIRNRSARDRAYEQVRSRILTLDLLPSQRLDENHIAEEVGVSRTPVREAFHQLAAEGLVTVVTRGGYVVADMDLLRFRELIEAQHILVRAVTHLLVARASEQDFDKLEAAVRAVDAAEAAHDPAAVAEKNSQLHILETELTGNSYLRTLAEMVYTHLQRLAFLSFGGSGRTQGVQVPGELLTHYRDVHDDHWEYLKALRSRDTSRAEETAVRHVKRFQNRIRSYLEANTVSELDLSDVAQTSSGS